jgi:uncharacterized protein (DUF1499 family)
LLPPDDISEHPVYGGRKMKTGSGRWPVSRILLAFVIMITMPDNIPAAVRLPPCPDTPNCVSSQALDKAHRVDPIPFTGSPDLAWERLRRVLESESRLRVVDAQDQRYLHTEVRSLIFRFVDDVEFVMDNNEKRIHIRSASRSGYSDLGVNRRRAERIRRKFLETQASGSQ